MVVLRPLLSVVEGPFETARGSLNETQMGIRVAVAWGYVSNEAAVEVLESLHCLGGRVYGLVRR